MDSFYWFCPHSRLWPMLKDEWEDFGIAEVESDQFLLAGYFLLMYICSDIFSLIVNGTLHSKRNYGDIGRRHFRFNLYWVRVPDSILNYRFKDT